MAEIRLERVTKVFAGDVNAVDDVSLTIGSGEFMVLVGPSGCGKSTALRSIAGLEEITGGTISIGERVVNDLPPKELKKVPTVAGSLREARDLFAASEVARAALGDDVYDSLGVEILLDDPASTSRIDRSRGSAVAAGATAGDAVSPPAWPVPDATCGSAWLAGFPSSTTGGPTERW